MRNSSSAFSLPSSDFLNHSSDAVVNNVGDHDLPRWSSLLHELLINIISRVESSENEWPHRRSVVACACVCKRWRDVTRHIVKSPLFTAKITFPSCLKQQGPHVSLIPTLKCVIKRDKKNSTFYLYLQGTSISSFEENGKFLLAAARYRCGANNEYIISLDANDISEGSQAYVGKLSSDFRGNDFTIYDSQSPHDGAKQTSPQVPAGNFEVGQLSYKVSSLDLEGPRKMICSVKFPGPAETILDQTEDARIRFGELDSDYTVLRYKAPRWHLQLQCWCLNFRGRVTVSSSKNFQLTPTVDQNQPGGEGDEVVVLQFGKVGSDTFTMDYRQPLSAFQAFAICLSRFKLACD